MMMDEETYRKEFRRLTDKQFEEKYFDMVKIGTGSFGEVFKGRTVHGRYVALKKFKSEAVQRFYLINREISNLKKLQHPNIVQFFDCYIVNENKYYLVTEFCEGGTLYDFV